MNSLYLSKWLAIAATTTQFHEWLVLPACGFELAEPLKPIPKHDDVTFNWEFNEGEGNFVTGVFTYTGDKRWVGVGPNSPNTMAGTLVTCWVDGDDPKANCQLRDSKGYGYPLQFPAENQSSLTNLTAAINATTGVKTVTFTLPTDTPELIDFKLGAVSRTIFATGPLNPNGDDIKIHDGKIIIPTFAWQTVQSSFTPLAKHNVSFEYKIVAAFFEGTFTFPGDAKRWVGVGPSSPNTMAGTLLTCYLGADAPLCQARDSQGYGYPDQFAEGSTAAPTILRTSGSTSPDDINTISFFTDLSSDLFQLGNVARTIWATGPLSGDGKDIKIHDEKKILPFAWVSIAPAELNDILPDGADFSWTILGDKFNGRFSYTGDGRWIGVGPTSPSGMVGLLITCYTDEAGDKGVCEQRDSPGYGKPPLADNQTITNVVGGLDGQTGVKTVQFTVPLTFDGFGLGSTARTVWAAGPMNGADDIKKHDQTKVVALNWAPSLAADGPPTQNFITPDQALYIIGGLLVLAAAANILVNHLFKLRIHHNVRDVYSLVISLLFVGAAVTYCYAYYAQSHYIELNDKKTAIARMWGQASVLMQGGLLLSAGRRFIFQGLLGVSHERAVVYHASMGVLILITACAHFYTTRHITETTRVWRKGGIIAFAFLLIGALPAMVRHYVSYRFFRVLHFSWIVVIIFTITHLGWKLLPFFIYPGLANVVLSFLYGLVTNLTARIVSVERDPKSQVTVLKMVRRTCCTTTWLPAAGQWCYLYLPKISLWEMHPFSLARSHVALSEQSGTAEQHMTFMIKSRATAVKTGWFSGGRGQSCWTQRLLSSSALLRGRMFGLGGPFGQLTLPLKAYREVLLVSGGIGVTSNLSIMQHLAQLVKSGQHKNTQLQRVTWVWVNRCTAMERHFVDLISADAADLRAGGVEVSLQHFITGGGSSPASDGIANKSGRHDTTDGTEMPLVQADRYPPTSQETASTVNMIDGRPDFPDLLAETLGVAKRSCEDTVALYLCGPPTMVKACKKAARGIKAVHLNEATFEL